MPIKGSCLCRTVRYEIDGKISDIGQCHCSKCRKVSGAAAATIVWTKAASFRWTEGEDQLTRFKQSDTYESVFCSRCGSPMPGGTTDHPIRYIPVGTLDDDPAKRGVAVHIYVDSKAPWDVIEGNALQLPEGFTEEQKKRVKL